MFTERYEGEEQDLRDEYSHEEYDEDLDELKRDAGCTDACEPDCSCVQDMVDDRQERKDLEKDYWASRGVH